MAYRPDPAPLDQAPPAALKWPEVNEALASTLPPVLRGVLTALGFIRARAFLEQHGGVNVCIPKHASQRLGLTDDELLRLRIALSRHMDSDGRVTMPKVDKLFLRARDAQIREEKKRKTINELARAHDLSSKQICNICREDDKQFKLF